MKIKVQRLFEPRDLYWGVYIGERKVEKTKPPRDDIPPPLRFFPGWQIPSHYSRAFYILLFPSIGIKIKFTWEVSNDSS